MMSTHHIQSQFLLALPKTEFAEVTERILVSLSLDVPHPAHHILLSRDTDSLRSNIIQLFKSNPVSAPLLVADHSRESMSSAYRGIKNAFSSFFVSLYASGDSENVLRFNRKLHSVVSDFSVLVSFIPEACIDKSELADVGNQALHLESELFPIVQNLLVVLSEHFDSRVVLVVNELEHADRPTVNLLKYLVNHSSANHWILLVTGTDSTDIVPPIQFIGEGRTDVVVRTLDDVPFNKPTPGDQNNTVSPGDDAATTPDQWTILTQACNQLLYLVAYTGGVVHGLLREWFAAEGESLQTALGEAIESGMLASQGEKYVLSHDRNRELVMNRVSSHEKEEIHYRVGCIAFARGNRKNDIESFVISADLFNEIIEAVRLKGEATVAADANFHAAEFFKGSNPARAKSYYTAAAALLKQLGWNSFEEIQYRTFEALAKLEYELGEYDHAEEHFDYLLDRVVDPEKRGVLFEFKVIVNNRLGRYRKSVLILKEGLSEYGVDMPWGDAQTEQVNAHLTAQLLRLEHDAVELPDVTPVNRRAILKLLFVGGMSLHHSSGGLMTWGALQIIRYAGEEVDAPERAIGYVVYGRVQMIKSDIEKGYAYGQKALKINRHLNDIKLRCRVYGIFAFFIQPWKRSFNESFALLTEAELAGTSSGDMIGTYVVKTHKFNLLLLAGKPLSMVLDVPFEETCLSDELTYYITHYQRSLVRFLMNETSVFSIPHLEPSWLAATNTIQEEKFYRNYVWSRYYLLFGYYELAEEAAHEADENRKLQEGSLLIPANYFNWFLSISMNWHNLGEARRTESMPLLLEIVEKFKIWSRFAPANFVSCYYLLLAELTRIGESGDAAHLYANAISSADEHLWHKSIAYELLARFFLSRRDTEEGVSALRESMHCYAKWGAMAKVSQLQQQFKPYLGMNYGWDVAVNIEEIQQELGGHLDVSLLMTKLLTLCLRMSGSSFAVLASAEGDREPEIRCRLALLPGQEQEIDASIIQRIQTALRTRRIFSENPAAVPSNGRATLNVNASKSILVVPVFLRDHLSFFVYLENSTGTRYNDETIRLVRVALNQGAITIENARIHELSLKLNAEIRRKMEDRERLMEELKEHRDQHLRTLEHTQNEDRKRIASHLHDSVGSMLSSIKIRLNGFQQIIKDKVPDKSKKFDDTISLIDETVHELRRIVYDMLPISLSRFGLRSTLQTFVDQINESENVEIELQMLGLDQRLSDEFEMAIYRICQELVQNALKHGQASRIRIQLIVHTDEISIIVEDDGKGLDKGAIVTGIGFNTIQAKVTLFKGNFSIESNPGRGTMVLIDLPLNHVQPSL